MTHDHAIRFALIQTPNGDAVLAVDDISHAVPYDPADAHHAFATTDNKGGVRVHFKAKGSTHLDLPGITPAGLAEALNGAPF
jgi:hypothetical protein